MPTGTSSSSFNGGRSFGQLLKRILGSFIFIGFGSLAVLLIWKEWDESPQSHFQPVEGVVSDHSVRIDMSRWKEANPAPLRLDSQVLLDGGQRVIVSDFFESADDAWDAALAKPADSRRSFFASPYGQTFVWSRHPSFPLGPLLFVCTFVLLGISVWVPFGRIFSTGFIGPIVVAIAFLSIGVFVTSKVMASTTKGIRASAWPAVKYEEIGTQRLKTGKRGSEATAFRYNYADRSYETVVRGRPSPDGMCRVNPDKPWVTALSVGLGANVLALFFAVPFLAGGLCLPVIFYANSPNRKALTTQPWYRVFTSAFVLVFTGSIVSVFVVVCGIGFKEGKVFAWFLAAFLLPFVYLVGTAAKRFMTELRTLKAR